MSGTTTDATIVFNEIPYNWLVPGTYVEVRPNFTNMGIAPYPVRVLIQGQMMSGNQGTPLVTYPLISAEQARALYGAGSQAADMAAAFLNANAFTQVDIQGISDPSGSKAVGSITPTSVATASGLRSYYIAGQQVNVPVGVGDSLPTIKANIIADINAIPTMPVVASSGSGNTVTLTANHVGLIGNMLDIRVNYNVGDATPLGFADTIVAMTGGTGSISYTAAFAAIPTTWYTDVVQPSFDTDGSMNAVLDARYMAMGRLDMQAYAAFSGSYGNTLTLSATLNERFRSTMPVFGAPQPPWIWAAAIAGVSVFALGNDPARQLRGKVLPGILAPTQGDAFTPTEQNILLGDGMCTFEVLNDGTIAISRMVSENKTDSLGIANTAWQDINAARVASVIRYDWVTYSTLVWGTSKLTDDGSIAAEYDETIATPSRVKGSWAGRSLLYERNGWIEGSAATAAASVFVRDPNNKNRLNARQQINRVGNLITLAAALEFQV